MFINEFIAAVHADDLEKVMEVKNSEGYRVVQVLPVVSFSPITNKPETRFSLLLEKDVSFSATAMD